MRADPPAMARTKEAMVLGYANNMVTYIPDARIVREGGYEGAGLQQYFLPGPFTENLGAEIKAIVTKALDSLAKQDAQR